MVSLLGCRLSESRRGISVEMYLIFPLFHKYYIHCKTFRKNTNALGIFFSLFFVCIISIIFLKGGGGHVVLQPLFPHSMLFAFAPSLKGHFS